MIYNENSDIRKLLKLVCIQKNITLKELASNADLLPQELNNILLKRHISFDDIKRLADANGMQLNIDLLPKEE